MAFQAHATQTPRAALADDLREASGSAPSLVSRSLASSQRHSRSLSNGNGQTWVLFPPTAVSEAQTTSSFLTINETVTTPSENPSIVRSDFLPRSEDTGAEALASQELDDDEDDDDEYDEDAELDILDSHLADFRSGPTVPTPAPTPVLPGHDGLGTFRVPDFATNRQTQDQLYAFEQFNPNSIQNTRESLEKIQSELLMDPEELEAAERRARIEAWRLEHSRVLLEEIQKETRRQRRLSANSTTRTKKQAFEGSIASEAIEEEPSITPLATQADETEHMEWHDDSVDDRAVDELADEQPKGFLDRITHKVIRDMLDLSDHDLAIIFGDTYVDDENEAQATPRAASPSGHPGASDQKNKAENMTPKEDSWQLRMVEGVAKELGIFVNSVSPYPHPGAFSTYKRVQQDPLPYAGLEAIPEASTPSAPRKALSLLESISQSALQFKPSFAMLQGSGLASPRPEENQSRAAGSGEKVTVQKSHGQQEFTQEEWEKDLDIKLVFKYLRSRFVYGTYSANSSVNGSPATQQSSTTHVKTATRPLNAQESAAKAARIRQQHPLIGGRIPADRRSFKAMTGAGAGRHHGSVRSQGTRRSARRGSASSKHYWDLGGSLGSGSVVAEPVTNGPMGSWGEI